MAAEKEETESVMNKEEKAFLMKALWKALQSPQWKKDDIITFGKAIFFSLKNVSKNKENLNLGKIPEETFEKILPFLSAITESLGEQLSNAAEAETKKKSEALAETAVEKEDEK